MVTHDLCYYAGDIWTIALEAFMYCYIDVYLEMWIAKSPHLIQLFPFSTGAFCSNIRIAINCVGTHPLSLESPIQCGQFSPSLIRNKTLALESSHFTTNGECALFLCVEKDVTQVLIKCIQSEIEELNTLSLLTLSQKFERVSSAVFFSLSTCFFFLHIILHRIVWPHPSIYSAIISILFIYHTSNILRAGAVHVWHVLLIYFTLRLFSIHLSFMKL